LRAIIDFNHVQIESKIKLNFYTSDRIAKRIPIVSRIWQSLLVNLFFNDWHAVFTLYNPLYNRLYNQLYKAVIESVRRTVDLSVDWRSLVAAVVFAVDFHDAGVTVKHVAEVVGRLVAIQDAAECAVTNQQLGLVS